MPVDPEVATSRLIPDARGPRGSRRASHYQLRPTRDCVRILGEPMTGTAQASPSSRMFHRTERSTHAHP